MPLAARVGPGFRAVAAPVLRRFTSPKYAGLLEYGNDVAGAYILRRGLFMPWELPDVLDPDLAREGWRALETRARLEEKESEVAALLDELATLKSSLEISVTKESETRSLLETVQSEHQSSVARESEANARIEALQAEHEARLSLEREEYEAMTTGQREEADRLTREIAALRETISEQSARLESEIEQRTLSLAQVDELQGKLERRAESIRELQDQLSAIMLQRTSRDNEISLLKEKLGAVEEELSEARQAEALAALASATEPPSAAVDSADGPPPVAVTVPLVDEASLAAAIHRSLTAEVAGEEEGTPLDEIVPHPQPALPKKAKKPKKAVEPAPPAANPSPHEKKSTGDEGHTIYFNEGTTTLSAAEREKIDLCARTIRRFGSKVEVTVIGYAGAEGSPDQNERLSAGRADAVRERLLEKGVSQSLVTVRGAGQDRRFTDRKAFRVEMIVAPVAVAEAVN